MSMTMYVFLSISDVPNTNSLNELSKQLNSSVHYMENVDLKEHTGFLPIQLSGNNSGVEIYMLPLSEFLDYFPSFDSSTFEKPVVITFRWGGDMNEMLVALKSAYLLGYEKQSAVFEPQSGGVSQMNKSKKGLMLCLGTAYNNLINSDRRRWLASYLGSRKYRGRLAHMWCRFILLMAGLY
ncbi:hypothetical protein L1077_26250 [Pseudoalteromonas luteoviolacea]|uniref:hypothetical protein n=1 Tax=Pseudoalteromonas luteoviolacea TaxID=43657 RepID=UPI001F1AF4BB|nr:hypothetical protein [Pseudoalteromonas luteoviolacea]MCF6442930.1 hypothetical protein [Pseudoalteromonas luteoviolacea]